jgi:hypothetical protein
MENSTRKRMTTLMMAALNTAVFFQDQFHDWVCDLDLPFNSKYQPSWLLASDRLFWRDRNTDHFP